MKKNPVTNFLTITLLLFGLIFNSCIYTSVNNYPKLTKSQVVEIREKIDFVIVKTNPDINIGIKVVSTKTSEVIYEKDSDHLFTPASNTKLFIAAAALHFLGPYFRYVTKVYTDSNVNDGIINGNLYIKGSGDPDFVDSDLGELVESLKFLGVKSVTGDIIVDNTEFDDVPFGPGWMWDDGASWYWAPVDAMTLNDNCVRLFVNPGKHLNDAPVVKIQPNTNYVTTEIRAITIENDTTEVGLDVERRWQTKENIIDVSGTIASNSTGENFTISVETPALYTGTIFKELMQQAGINFSGLVKQDSVPPDPVFLVSHTSAPLNESVTNFLKISDNLTGELLVKKIGAVTDSSMGTWDNGLRAIKTFLQDEVGIDTTKMVLADGSGVSRYNLISASQIVQLLVWIHDNFQIYPEFASALPIGGSDGTLRNRLFAADVKTNTRAKTGTLQGVTALSGYVITTDNEILAFSILMRGYVGSPNKYRALQDKIVTILSGFSRF